MVKTIGLVSILCALAITGWMWAQKSFQATESAPSAILDAAATALEFSHRSTGTYAVPAPDGVKLIWADQFRYCIERGGWFIQGPGGTAAEGRCPR